MASHRPLGHPQVRGWPSTKANYPACCSASWPAKPWKSPPRSPPDSRGMLRWPAQHPPWPARARHSLRAGQPSSLGSSDPRCASRAFAGVERAQLPPPRCCRCKEAARPVLPLAGALLAQPRLGHPLPVLPERDGEPVGAPPLRPPARAARTPSLPPGVRRSPRTRCSRRSPCCRGRAPRGRRAGGAFLAPRAGPPPAGLSSSGRHGERCARALGAARRAFFTLSEGARGAQRGWRVRAPRLAPACRAAPPGWGSRTCSRLRCARAVCVVYVSRRASYVRVCRLCVRRAPTSDGTVVETLSYVNISPTGLPRNEKRMNMSILAEIH